MIISDKVFGMKRSARYALTGAEIQAARRAAGLSQAMLAERAGVHVNSIKRLEGFETIPCSTWFALNRVAEQLPELLDRIVVPRPVHSARDAQAQLSDTYA